MVGGGIIQPPNVAKDGQGNVFIAETANNQVVEEKADGAVTTVGYGLNQPSGVAVDSMGDVFIADSGNNRVVEVTPGLPVTVSPATPTLTVQDGGSYNAQPFSAAATAVGVDGKTPVSGSFTVTYYAGSSASGTPLTGAPVKAGPIRWRLLSPAAIPTTPAAASDDLHYQPGRPRSR